MPDDATNDSTDALDSLRTEQVQVLSKNGLISIPMNFALAISIVIVMRNEVSNHVLLLWIVAVFLLNVTRLFITCRNLRRQFEPGGARRALQVNAAVMLVIGSIWAMVPGFMLDQSNPNAAAVYFLLAGISAGATLQSGSSSAGASAFSLPILGALFVKLLLKGEDSYFLAGDVILYLMVIVLSARSNERSFARTVLLKIEAKATAARFFELANHDVLTGLANRASFSTQMASWLDHARTEANGFYLFLLDLDHFKSINDTLGHSAGDEILKEAATRLAATVGGDNIVARLGGDEFAILFARSPHDRGSDEDEADRVVVRILSEFSGTFQLGERSVSIGVSIGVARFPDDGTTSEDLLAHADLALYAAKDGGRHRWRRFDASLLAAATMMRDIEHDLPDALSEGSLQVFYQPQVAIGDHRLAGLEALLRWNHPVHGWVAPPVIVVAASRIRSSDRLTEFLLDQACRQIRRLNDDGRTDVLVAINVSPGELGHYDLPGLVQRLIALHGIDCGRLEFEITEEAFAASPAALAVLSALSAMGVRLAIDDFGSGYSSIAYLRSMRINRIKIDRSFVTGFADRADDRILVQAIIGIGRSFGIEVLAEGVETADDVLLLKALGCGLVQGFYFGRPMSQVDLAAWQAEHHPLKAIAHRDVGLPPKADLVSAGIAAA